MTSFRARVQWENFTTMRCAFIAVVAIAVAGCGQESGSQVAGTVQIDGTPCPGGVIAFLSESGAATSARIQPNGTFLASGIPVGKVRATVTPPAADRRLPPKKDPDPHVHDGMPPESPIKKKDIAKRIEKRLEAAAAAIPKIYRDQNTSPLAFEIVAGTNSIEVKLNSKAK